MGRSGLVVGGQKAQSKNIGDFPVKILKNIINFSFMLAEFLVR